MLTTITNYYDKTNVHLFPTKVETTTSISAEKLRQEFKYVADFPSSGVLSVMNDLNMTGLAVEAVTSIVKGSNEYVTGFEKTEYYEWKPDKVYPKRIYHGKIPPNTLKSSFESNPGNYTQLGSQINAYGSLGTVVETEVAGDRPQAIIIDGRSNRVVAKANVSSASQIAYTSFESRDFGNWNINTGNSTTTAYVSLGLGSTFGTLILQSGQTINYSYSVTRSNGPSPVMIFTKEGSTPIYKPLFGFSGNGSQALTAGTWNVHLEYDFNVTAVDVEVSYQYTSQDLPSITPLQNKTGKRAFQLGLSQMIWKDNLPSGKYTVAYYQKGGSVTVTATGGASVLSTITSVADGDGWTKVQKEIDISAAGQSIQLTGTTSIYLDELRLHPSGAFMTTTCYDVFGKAITDTDANLRSKFIEYDEQRRVKIVRNHEGDILTQYDYEFAVN